MHDKFVMTSNWHLLGGVDLSSEGQTSLSFVDDYTQYHNYAIEWTTSKLIFYVDGKVVRNTIHGGMLNRPLWPIFSIGFSDYLAPLPENFPGEMKVDWIRAYKLKYDCGTTIDSCQYSFTTANSPVLKRISIGGSGCVNTVPQGADIYLRASEGIEISGDFTVPSGAELFLDSNPCLGE